MCLARGGVEGVGGEWVTGLGLGFWRNMWKVGYVSVFWFRWCGRLGPGSGRVGWCYGCVCCES